MIYDVIRNRRDQSGSHDEVVVRGLPLKEAREKAVELQHEYSKANPGKTSWTSDLFHIQLDTKLLEAAPDTLKALEDARNYLNGMAAYLATCATAVILNNLETTIAALHKEAEKYEAVIRKARGAA
jgi:HrpA-like RNA helicase